MIEATGLTSNPRKELPPAVDDVSFEAHAGHVTALLGAPGAGKTTVLRLMLELQRGRGITRFRGRPLHRIAHPSREVGVLLGDVPGHPGRTVRGHLRMLCAAAGVRSARADEVLEAMDLVDLRDERLGTLSRGMDRRLGVACALLPDPHTLVLDEPTRGLSAEEGRSLRDVLRAHADRKGTVLFATADPREAARAADRVVTLEAGRVVADQAAPDFARTRLRPRVAVRSPHAARLGVLIAKEARAARRSVEVVHESGTRLSVYGSTCADVGETAYRHHILVHQLADETGDMGPEVVTPAGGEREAASWRRTIPLPAPQSTYGAAPAQPPAAGATDPDALQLARLTTAELDAPQPARPAIAGSGAAAPPWSATAPSGTAAPSQPAAAMPDATALSRPVTAMPGGPASPQSQPAAAPLDAAAPARSVITLPDPPSPSPLPPPITVRPGTGPARPLRYELRRAAGIGTGYLTGAAVLVASALVSVVAARMGHTPQPRLLAAWPRELPLPPAALGAGLLGALASGDEFRHPALAADRGTVPRRLGLLAAKLLVAAATALLLAVLTVGVDTGLLCLVHGRELAEVPADWLALSAGWLGLVVGCAWAGVLAAGLFRSTTAGLAAVVAVPVVLAPLVRKGLHGPSARSAEGLPARLRELFLVQWPFGGERYLAAGVRVIAQPVATALTLSITALLCAYLFMIVRSRTR